MKTFYSTISSKGQITIPADVRRHLGVASTDTLAVTIKEDGTVELKPVHYTFESVLGSLKQLPNETPDLEQEIERATQENADRFIRNLKR